MNDRFRKTLDPEILARIGSLEVVARAIVEGTMVGMHQSKTRGAGSEFSQYRPYIAGDDLRTVDWRLHARTDRYYVKQFTTETNLHAWLMLDTSASMSFSSGGPTKFEAARMLAAAIAYLLVHQGDLVGTIRISDSERIEMIPPRGGVSHLHLICHALESMRPEGGARLTHALDTALTRLKKRGPVFLFSDCYEPAEELGEAVARYARAGFDLTLFHTLDPVERRFELDGYTEFVGLEEAGRVTADPAALRRRYLEKLNEHVGALRSACLAAGVEFVEIDTSESLGLALMQTLVRRRSVVRG